MGAKGVAAGSIAVGVLLGVLAIAFPPASAGFFYYASVVLAAGSMIAGGIIGLTSNLSGRNRDTAKAADLQYASAADGVPLPVIFGEQRVVGNFMNYTADNFRSKKVTGRNPGGKGGDSQPASIIGYDFFLYYEYGLCMGPIDEVLQVYSVPSERFMLGDSPVAVVYAPTEDYKELSLDSVDPVTSGGSEGGLVRLYKGASDQIRLISSDPYNYGTVLASGRLKEGYQYRIEIHTSVNFTTFGAASNDPGTVFVATSTSGNILTAGDSVTEFSGLNYRNICWALFIDFRLGRFPQPKSYHFVLRRFPAHDTGYEMMRPDGSSITGFKVRGSSDTSKPAYYQANPAAILYECMTNRIWGRGLPQEMFDEASWISVSAYFHARHIGMSFTMDTPDKLANVIDAIRTQVKTIMTWDGEFLKLRCLLDLTTTHGKIQTITKADVAQLKVTRQVWNSTINEVRAEFLNRSKNYRPDAVHVRDLGNRQMTGRTNPQKMTLNSFTDFNTTRRQAFRILMERSYPVALFEFEVNRFHSQLEVGDVFKLWWDEYDQDSTIYCMVAKIEDSDSDEDSIKVSAVEDLVLVPNTGSEATPPPPSLAAWEQIPDMDEDEVGLWTGIPLVSPTGNFPAVVIELPPIYANRLFAPQVSGWIAAIAQQPVANYSSLFTSVSLAGSSYPTLSHIVGSFAIAGFMDGDYEVCNYTDRLVGFTFTLFDPVKDEAALLSMFSAVDTINHHLMDIVNLTGPFVVIQDEILQIGKVDKLGTNSYRARNIVRGRFGTKITKRPDGTTVMFMATLGPVGEKAIPLFLDAGNTLGSNGVDRAVLFKFSAHTPNDTNSIAMNNDVAVKLFHDTKKLDGELDNEQFRRVSDSPLSAEMYDLTDAGATWTMRIRLRSRGAGGGTTGAFYTELMFKTPPLDSDGFTIVVGVSESDDVFRELNASEITITKVETNDNDKLSGLITIANIPKQFISSLPFDSTVYDTHRIHITVRQANGVYEGLNSVEDIDFVITDP